MITEKEMNEFAKTDACIIFERKLLTLLNAQTDNGILASAYVLQGLLLDYNAENKHVKNK